MRQFRLFIGHLAYVVEESGAACFLGIEAEFRCHDGAEIGRLAGVLQQVLSVARTVFHLTDKTYKVGMQAVDTEVDDGTLAGLDDFLLNLLAHFVDHLLDACRVDTAVGHELMECQTRYLAAHGVKTRKDNCLGGVVDDDFNTGGSLESTDIAAFATDDAAFDFIGVDVEHGD